MLEGGLHPLNFSQGRLQFGSALRVGGDLLFEFQASSPFLLQGLLQANQLVGHKALDSLQGPSPSSEVQLSGVPGLFGSRRPLLGLCQQPLEELL